MRKQLYISLLLLSAVIFQVTPARAQCALNSNVHTFTHNGTTYEIITEKQTWASAAQCAVERGGHLVHIDDMAEQQAVFQEVMKVVDSNYVTVSDGGGGSYIWIGANDLKTEGTWVWDGDNMGSTVGFWSGGKSGTPVGGKYNNWGGASALSLNEPDNFSGKQAVAAMGLKKWPVGPSTTYGIAGEWNDIVGSNQLYYIIEKTTNSVNGVEQKELGIKVYPNPVSDVLQVDINGKVQHLVATVIDPLGRVVYTSEKNNVQNININMKQYTPGVYMLVVEADSAPPTKTKIVKY